MFFKKISSQDATPLLCYFVILHFILFTLLFSAFYHVPHSDVLESFYWGKEWQLGYYKHPPLFSWISEIFITIFGVNTFTEYIISQVCVSITFVAIYFLAKEFFPKNKALICVLLCEGILYSNLLARPWNANFVQLPFWALIGLFYFYSIKYNKTLFWSLFGAFSALACLGKYFSILFIFCICISFLSNKKTVKYLKTKGPYIAITTFFVVISPHLFWLFKNNFSTLFYAQHRINSTFSLFFTLDFLGNILLTFLPCLVLYATLKRKIKFAGFSKLKRPEGNFLFCITVLPILILVLAQILLNLRVHYKWSTPMFHFIPIFLFYFFSGSISSKSFNHFVRVFAGFVALTVIAIVISGLDTSRRKGAYYSELEQVILYSDEKWSESYDSPIKFVVGNIDDAGYFSMKSRFRPSVIECGKTSEVLYINPDELKKYGAVIIYSSERRRHSADCDEDMLTFMPFVDNPDAVNINIPFENKDSLHILFISPHKETNFWPI